MLGVARGLWSREAPNILLLFSAASASRVQQLQLTALPGRGGCSGLRAVFLHVEPEQNRQQHDDPASIERYAGTVVVECPPCVERCDHAREATERLLDAHVQT